MTAPGPATSGIADLDRTLGGLFWGDNVVWELRRNASVEPFVRRSSLWAGRRRPSRTSRSRPRDGPAPGRRHRRDRCRRGRPARPARGAAVGRARVRLAAPIARSSSSIRSTPWPSAGARRSHAGSSRAAARCCSRSAPSRTGRSAARTRSRRCAARSRRSRSACSSSTTTACASSRPTGARRASRAAC